MSSMTEGEDRSKDDDDDDDDNYYKDRARISLLRK